MTTNREIRLAFRPRGWPTLDNFVMVETELPPPEDGQVQVRNLFMSVDPYMRGRMNVGPSFMPPFEVGQPLEGAAIGEVVVSRSDGLKPGDVVTSWRGWREHFVAAADEVQVVEAAVQPLSLHLGALGMTGLTAWVGLNLIDAGPGDTLLVSAAAGAVGHVAGQLAKMRGCRVIGSVGSEKKVKLLTEELGFAAAFNYRDGQLVKQLKAAAPDGLSVYFDNVGGELLEAVFAVIQPHGRIVACGAISRYNDETPAPGPTNLFMLIARRLTMKGFIVMDWLDRMPEFVREMRAAIDSGKVRVKETVFEGLEHAPQAFLRLFDGRNIGKMVVKIG